MQFLIKEQLVMISFISICARTKHFLIEEYLLDHGNSYVFMLR